MRRLPVFLVAAVLAIALLAVIASAQQFGGGGGRIMPGTGIQPSGPPELEGMERPAMAWGRMGQPAIAVSGTYVYVVSGGMLLQYDQSLTLVRSAELPGGAPGFGRGGGGGGRGMRGGGVGGPRGGGGGGRGMRGARRR